MNDLVQQLLNPVIHNPQGGRKYISEGEPRAEYTRDPKKIARNKGWYELRMQGLTVKQIAAETGARPSTVKHGVLTHSKSLED